LLCGFASVVKSTAVTDTDPDSLLRRVQELTGASDRAEVERVARATLTALCEALPLDARASLLAALPGASEASRVPAIARPNESLPAFYERVAVRAGLAQGIAVEHAQCVCRALAERLGADARARISRHLPDALAPLLVPVEREAPPPRRASPRSPPAPHTLSEGRAGSQRPLAAAVPAPAQAHSVASSDNPHGDTKLSSTRGATQEREQETLGEGRPGSKRPLDEG
jgi:uncharacterized protein (DUF2267 family)